MFTDCLSLKSLFIKVPEIAKSGDTVTLSCEYDLEQAALYTIKWYRNNEEFFRFVPKESPPFRAFPLPHVNVDVSIALYFKVIICLLEIIFVRKHQQQYFEHETVSLEHISKNNKDIRYFCKYIIDQFCQYCSCKTHPNIAFDNRRKLKAKLKETSLIYQENK